LNEAAIAASASLVATCVLQQRSSAAGQADYHLTSEAPGGSYTLLGLVAEKRVGCSVVVDG
jgi:hypothetical protein